MISLAGIAATSRNAVNFLVGYVLTFCALAALNAAADPFADFFYLTHWRVPRIRTFDDLTDIRFKSALVRRAGPGGLDAAIFGSSRVMSINPALPEFHALAPRAFNLGVQGARLGIARQFVEFVARRDPQCLAVVGLDFFAFQNLPIDRSIFLDEAHPFPAWRICLSRLGSSRIVPDSWSMLHGMPVANQLRSNGLAIRARRDPAEVDAQLARFVASDWRQWPHFRDFHYDPARIDILRDIRRRLPRVVFFINPATRQYYQAQRLAGLDLDYHRWLDDLGSLGGVIDFSEATAITDDARLFHDMHHYTTEAGAMILRDVAAHLRGEPLRFGRVLTPAPANP